MAERHREAAQVRTCGWRNRMNDHSAILRSILPHLFVVSCPRASIPASAGVGRRAELSGRTFSRPHPPTRVRKVRNPNFWGTWIAGPNIGDG